MRTRLLVLIAAIAAAIVLAACGSDDSTDKPAAKLNVSDGPAKIVPADAPIYFQALLRPGDEQTEAIKDVISKVSNGKVKDPGAEIVKAIEESASDSDGADIKFDDDIDPWLGTKAAVFSADLSSDPRFAAIIESTDKGKAEDFVQKAKESGDEETIYKGTDLLIDDDTGVAVADDYLLIGDVDAVKSALDVRGNDNLANNATFAKTAKTVNGSLGFGFVSIGGLKDAIESSLGSGTSMFTPPQALTGEPSFNDDGIIGGSGGDSDASTEPDFDADVLLDLLDDTKIDAIGLGADLSSDSATLEFAAIGGEAPAAAPSSLLPELPADALVGFGAGNLGEGATKALDQIDKLDPSGAFRKGLEDLERETDLDLEKDLFSWMDDSALFVRGTGASDIGGALIVKTTDPAATADAIGKLKQLTSLADINVDTGPITDVDADEGFEIDSKEIGVPLQVAVKGYKFVIAIGNDALEDALEPSGTLGDSDTYKDATGMLASGSNPVLFVDIPQIVGLVENLTDNDPGFQELKPYLDAFGPLVAGTHASNGSPVTQVTVGISD